MRITLSERKLSERIRELESLGPEVTTEEITYRFDHYCRHLFEHLRAYGLNQIGLVGMHGTLGEFYVGLDACHDDESRNTRIRGLALLDPLSVTLEHRDLPAFFVGALLVMMQDAFDSYAAQFQRLTVGELDTGLVRAAEKIFAAPQAALFEAQTESDVALLQEYQDEQFEMFCRRAGLKVPGAERQKRDAAEQAEINRIKAAEQQRLDEFIRGPQD